MLPLQIKLALAAVFAVGLVTAGWTARGWREDSQKLHDERILKIATQGAAEEIAKIKVQNTTIRQTLEKETREKLVYTECRHSPDSFRLLNSALLGGVAGLSELPSSNSPSR